VRALLATSSKKNMDSVIIVKIKMLLSALYRDVSHFILMSLLPHGELQKQVSHGYVRIIINKTLSYIPELLSEHDFQVAE